MISAIHKKASPEWVEKNKKSWEKHKDKYFEEFLAKVPIRVSTSLRNGKFTPNKIPKQHPPQSAVVYGESRTGKTMSVYNAIWEYTEFYNIEFMGSHRLNFKVIKLATFLKDLQNTFNDKRADYATIFEEVQKIPLLVIDDIGTEKLTEWAYSTLFQIVDYRYEQMLPTWYTSNFSVSELAENFLEERLLGRILTDCDIIHFDGKQF